MTRRGPGFTAVAVLSLALGIGANTAIFSLIEAIVLRMLPVKNPQQLAQVLMVSQGPIRDGFSYPVFEQLRIHNQVFAGLFAWSGPRFNMRTTTETQSVAGTLVTGDFFETLGVPPLLGRTLIPADDRPSGEPVAVISYSFWQRMFAGEPSAVGRTICLEGAPVTVVGVTRG